MRARARYLSIAFAICTALLLIAILYLLQLAGRFDRDWHLFEIMAGTLIVALLLVPTFAVALGLWYEKTWAWYLGVVVCCLTLLLGLRLSFGSPSGVIVFGVAATGLWQFFESDRRLLRHLRDLQKGA